jgi:hypothetical protein
VQQVSSESFGFPCQAFYRLLHPHHHPSIHRPAVTSVIADSFPLHLKTREKFEMITNKISILISNFNTVFCLTSQPNWIDVYTYLHIFLIFLGGRSVGIVRSRTQTMELLLLLFNISIILIY